MKYTRALNFIAVLHCKHIAIASSVMTSTILPQVMFVQHVKTSGGTSTTSGQHKLGCNQLFRFLSSLM